MAAENFLWGAPRIHGELLKLGIGISERMVSRYLRGRSPRRSQTWRTFFANHFGDPTLTSPVMSADAGGDDIVVDASDVSFRTTQLPINGSCVSAHRAVDCALPLQPTFLGMHLRQEHRITCRTVKAHATAGAGTRRRIHGCNCDDVRPRVPFVCACSTSATDGTVKVILPREFTIGNPTFPSRGIESSTLSHGDRNIGEARWARSR
jgi:hypothetical protein